ncbi:MAG: hypothetical protein SGJ23_11150 [Alphaproteobacteria bacterium]|nr:hypothetical protein [Alphaproteobacteria bacterium]
MSSDPTPPPEKTRLPQPIALGGGWRFLYVILAVGFTGAAIYRTVVQQAPLTEPGVVVCALGAVWFAVRAALSFRAKP